MLAPMLAMFELDATKAVWQLDDSEPNRTDTTCLEVLEFLPSPKRYWVDALFPAHVRSFFTEG